MGTAEFALFDVEGDLDLVFDVFVLFDDSFVSVTVSTYLVLGKVTTWGINLLYLYAGLTEMPRSIR